MGIPFCSLFGNAYLNNKSVLGIPPILVSLPRVERKYVNIDKVSDKLMYSRLLTIEYFLSNYM